MREGVVKEKGVYVHPDSRFDNKKTRIGRGTRINGPITTTGLGEVYIGPYCAMGEEIKIITSNHFTGHANMQESLQLRVTGDSLMEEPDDIFIGANCWIGDRAVILPGVSIGPGCVIGAGSVITKSVHPFWVMAGSPARFVRQRFGDPVCEWLMTLKWWDWSEKKMKRNKHFFELDLRSVADPSTIKIYE
jgi:virginiamycin A acetyltransferase